MRISSVGSEVGLRMGALVGASFRPASAGARHALVMRAAELASAWRAMSLVRRYLVVALLAFAIFTAVSGLWVSRQIERGIVDNQTHSVIALIHDVVEPLVQALPTAETLPPEATAAFDNLLSASGVANQVAVMRLWRPNGELVYTSDQAVGGTGAPSATDLDQAALEEKLGIKLFQIHAPLYKTGTREIIAVAQLYGVADSLHAELGWVRAQTWLVLGLLALAVTAALFKIMQSAGAQIEQQQRVIGEKKAETARLISRNEALRKLVDMIHRRGMEHNERLLRRIGSDLHDGPAQHLALVLLRLDELAPASDKPVEPGASPGTSGDALQTIRRATSDALREIRHISAGLALPELQKISLTDALVIAVRAHQRATGTRVETAFGNLPARLPLPITICLYRFAQEALNNAFRHAGGNGQRLRANYDGTTISVEVADSGPGFIVDRPATGGERLGLPGLRYRVESLGGSLQINSAIGQGTRLTVQFRNPLA
jgi:signal transduction histidine kinase